MQVAPEDASTKYRYPHTIYAAFLPRIRWIPHTKSSDALMFSLICIWIDGWEGNCEAGD